MPSRRYLKGLSQYIHDFQKLSERQLMLQCCSLDNAYYGRAAYGTTTPQNDTTNRKNNGTNNEAKSSFGEKDAIA